jgi:hypothetical protein
MFVSIPAIGVCQRSTQTLVSPTVVSAKPTVTGSLSRWLHAATSSVLVSVARWAGAAMTAAAGPSSATSDNTMSTFLLIGSPPLLGTWPHPWAGRLRDHEASSRGTG